MRHLCLPLLVALVWWPTMLLRLMLPPLPLVSTSGKLLVQAGDRRGQIGGRGEW